MARLAGLEPATPGSEAQCSILLSYRRWWWVKMARDRSESVGASDGVRTRDLLCHRQAP